MKRSEIGVRGKLRNGKVLGTQNVLGTPREPFSHLLYEMLFVYEIFIVQTWVGWWEKNVQVNYFCVRTDEPVAYVPSIKGKDQHAVVRLKISKS